MQTKTLVGMAGALLALALAACGGSDGTAPTEEAALAQPQVANPPAPTLAQRIAAATATAQSSSNHCGTLGAFYWEIGNRALRLASGSITTATGPNYEATTSMNIASATKWLYAAYAVQRDPVLTPEAVKFLTFQSGHTNFSICMPWHSVDSCLAFQTNGDYSPENDGKFYYNGGHMQKHASLIGLGPLHNAGLASELQSQLGNDIALSFSQPQPPGGVVTTPADYARFLRKLMDGTLHLGNMLGAEKVCTNPATCASAVYTPVPETESWNYSLGHWVEDDPNVGDGAFSSTGAFGFYPWIDKDRRYYGIVARQGEPGTGYQSVQCGRLVRKAWMTGTAQ